MRFYATFLILLLPQLGPAGLYAQLADSPQDTSAVDSALVARLQKQVDWRELIRVRTDGVWLLRHPSVSARGLDYDDLKVMEAPPGGPLPPRPIPLPAVLAIEARQGNPKAGMILGGAVGVGLATTVVYGLSNMDGGDGNVLAALGVGIIMGGPTGVLFGSFLGEAMYSWESVYVAEPAGERGPP